MIGKLKGVIDSYADDHVILDVHGVGYVVQCSVRTLQKLPKVGEAAALAIETQVREDAIRLFGFMSDAERDWFRLLQSVQGVGSKVALAILGILPPGDLATAIAMQDKVAVARAPGVGPKLAQRLHRHRSQSRAPLGRGGQGRPETRAGCDLGARQSRLRPPAGRRRRGCQRGGLGSGCGDQRTHPARIEGACELRRVGR
jgi:Holliday junction resolvasome RuvABC DNA-binding subunit